MRFVSVLFASLRDNHDNPGLPIRGTDGHEPGLLPYVSFFWRNARIHQVSAYMGLVQQDRPSTGILVH